MTELTTAQIEQLNDNPGSEPIGTVLNEIVKTAEPAPSFQLTEEQVAEAKASPNKFDIDSFAEFEEPKNLCPEVPEQDVIDLKPEDVKELAAAEALPAPVQDPMADLAFDPLTDMMKPGRGKPGVKETAAMLAAMATMIDSDPASKALFGKGAEFLDSKILAPMSEQEKKEYLDKKAEELVKQRDIHDHNQNVANARQRKQQAKHGKGGNAKAQRKAMAMQEYLNEHASNPVAFKLQVEGGFAYVSPNDMLTFDKPVSAAWGLHLTRIKGYPRDPEVYVKENQFVHPSTYKVGYNDAKLVKTLYLGPRV